MNAILASVVDIQAGHPFRGSVPPVEGGNAFALQMRDIRGDGLVEWGGLVRTHIEAERRPQWLRPGDVVFAARGGRNYAVCLSEVPIPAVCSQYFFLLRVRATGTLLPEFLAWQINRAPAQRFLASNAEGSDQLSIRRGVLETLPLALPPLSTQHAIVGLADTAMAEKRQLEALIRNRQQQLDALAFGLLANNDIPAVSAP